MQTTVILGTVLTAVTAAAAALLCRPVGLRGLALAVGGGLLAGLMVVRGWPGLPPAESSAWLPHFAIAAAILGTVEDAGKTRPALRWTLRLMLTAALIWLLLKPLHTAHWQGPQRWMFPAALLGGTTLCWIIVEQRTHRMPRILLPLTLLASGTAAVELFSGFMKFAQIAAMLAVALGVCWLLSLVVRLPDVAPGGLTVAIVVLAGLWIGGFFYGDMPPVSAVLLAVAPVLLWLAPAPRTGRRRQKLAALQVLLVGLPIAIAVLVAYRSYVSDPYRS